jgi:hypothetical protein
MGVCDRCSEKSGIDIGNNIVVDKHKLPKTFSVRWYIIQAKGRFITIK